MDLIELLDSDVLDLPKSYDSWAGSFDEYVEEIFGKYQKALGALRGHDYLSTTISPLASKAKVLCESIRQCLKEYLRGYPSTAYQVLAADLDSNKALVEGMCSVEIAKALTHLYRVRRSATPIRFRSDLFHVGFENRRLVATARYSIPGLPCLYFGGSIWLCWKELQEPDLKQLHISRFQSSAAANCRVLDFGFRPALWAALLDSGKYTTQLQHDSELARLITAQVICWPLVAASSIKVRHPTANFRVEYIVPQLILQWLTKETAIDGILYFSTKVQAYANDPVAVANFVFPARKVNGSGYCAQLASKFWLSEPLSWSELISHPSSVSNAPHLNFDVENAAGLIVPYGTTDWAHAQNVLASVACGPV